MARTKREPAVPAGFQPYDDGLPDEQGCLRLVEAFWRKVRQDLAAGSQRTYRWLATEDFEVWCAIGVKADPVEVRNHLLTVWEGRHHAKRRRRKSVQGDLPHQPLEISTTREVAVRASAAD